MLLNLLQNVLLTFDKVQNPLRLPRKTTSERPKVVRACGAFNILTWKCASCHNGGRFFNISIPKSAAAFTLLTSTWASRHNGMHFFDMSTSKSAPMLVCFARFDLEMCFAPQRRALFRHRNFYKCSEAELFCTFWLPNVLGATTACNFSSLIWPDGSALAAFASLQIFGKPQWIATFLPASSFFSLFLTLSHSFSSLLSSLLWLFPPLLFHPSMLSEVWLLNFLRWSPCWKMGGSLNRTRPFVVPLGAFFHFERIRVGWPPKLTSSCSNGCTV